MKLNKTLFLITATLGLMAASSVTMAANPNYIRIYNNSDSQQVQINVSWVGAHTDLGIDQLGTTSLHSGNYSINHTIYQGGSVTIVQSADPSAGADRGHSGSLKISFYNNGQIIGATTFHCHCYYNNPACKTRDLDFNHLNYGVVVNNTNPNIAVWLGSGSGISNSMTKNGNVNCNDDTHMFIEISSPSSPSSPSSLSKLFKF